MASNHFVSVVSTMTHRADDGKRAAFLAVCTSASDADKCALGKT
jgi:hypothetical protein